MASLILLFVGCYVDTRVMEQDIRIMFFVIGLDFHLRTCFQVSTGQLSGPPSEAWFYQEC